MLENQAAKGVVHDRQRQKPAICISDVLQKRQNTVLEQTR